MSQQELLRIAVGVLEAAGVDYMLTGSLVSSLQGEPRASHDIDVVVSLTMAGIKALTAEFRAPSYYLDEPSMVSAMNSVGEFRQFNLLDSSTGDKIDFWILSDEAFDRARFNRKYVDEISGVRVKVSRPEDTILMKLRWAAMSGGSEKQFQDALAVYQLQFSRIDHRYIEQWARQLDVEALWDRLKAVARVVNE